MFYFLQIFDFVLDTNITPRSTDIVQVLIEFPTDKINSRDVQRKNVVNNVDTMYVKFKGTKSKRPVQKQTHITAQTRNVFKKDKRRQIK